MPPFSDNCRMRLLSTTMPTDAFSVCSTAASPATVIVSDRLPSSSFTSMRGAVLTFTAIPSRTQRWKPVSSTSSR